MSVLRLKGLCKNCVGKSIQEKRKNTEQIHRPLELCLCSVPTPIALECSMSSNKLFFHHFISVSHSILCSRLQEPGHSAEEAPSPVTISPLF